MIRHSGQNQLNILQAKPMKNCWLLVYTKGKLMINPLELSIRLASFTDVFHDRKKDAKEFLPYLNKKLINK